MSLPPTELPATTPVAWPRAHRIIRTVYPPVWLFEDIADAADWELIASAEAKTNPRVRDAIGDLSLVPPHRRVSGPTASLVMGAFTHASRHRPSRFSDGSYGVWYCGERFEVALAETAFHFARFMRATAEPAADAQFRELVCAIRGELCDLRSPGAHADALLPDALLPDALLPDDWHPGQVLGAAVRAAGGDGILYPSVRLPAGLAAALFWPDGVVLPITQARHLRYHWDGARMSRYFVYGENEWYAWP